MRGFGAEGKLILACQPGSLMLDRWMITEAGALIEQAAALGRPGPYQIQAPW